MRLSTKSIFKYTARPVVTKNLAIPIGMSS